MNIPLAEVTKTYRRSIPNTWWLKKSSYLLFMLRELSSVFVALYALCLLSLVYAVSQGPESYAAWVAGSRSGGMILLHVVMLLFVLYHTVTWFRISGRIFGREGSGAPSPAAVTTLNYVIWIVISLGVMYIILS